VPEGIVTLGHETNISCQNAAQLLGCHLDNGLSMTVVTGIKCGVLIPRVWQGTCCRHCVCCVRNARQIPHYQLLHADPEDGQLRTPIMRCARALWNGLTRSQISTQMRPVHGRCRWHEGGGLSSVRERARCGARYENIQERLDVGPEVGLMLLNIHKNANAKLLVLLNVVDGDVAAAQERVCATQIGIQQSHAHRVWVSTGPCARRQFCTCCWYREGEKERKRATGREREKGTTRRIQHSIHQQESVVCREGSTWRDQENMTVVPSSLVRATKE